MLVCFSECKDIQHLPIVAKGIQLSPEYRDTMAAIQAAAGSADQVIRECQQLESHVVKDARGIAEIIDECCETLIGIINDLKNEAKTELAKRKDIVMESISVQITDYSKHKASLDATIANIKTFEEAFNECQLFTDLKQGQKVAAAVQKIVRERETTAKNQTLEFTLSDEIQRLLRNCPSLGKFGLHIKDHDDKHVSNVTDMCQLTNGEFLVTDTGNKKVKHLDAKYQIRNSIQFTSKPLAVCEVDASQAAVLLQEGRQSKVQFIDTNSSLACLRSFPIGLNYTCYGMTFVAGELYVSCTDHRIRVFGLDGKLQWTLQNDGHGRPMFKEPRNLLHNAEHQVIHVCDDHIGVVTLDLEGFVVNTAKLQKALKWPRGLSTDLQGGVFVCSMETDAVLRLDPENGSQARVLLRNIDGIQKPSAVCYDKNRKKLLVVNQKSDTINVFSVH